MGDLQSLYKQIMSVQALVFSIVTTSANWYGACQELLPLTILIRRLAFPKQIIDEDLQKSVVHAHAFDVPTTALLDVLHGGVLLDEIH